jgi:hypothetical protein
VNNERIPVMTPNAMSWGYRIVWALCAGVYLAVFISGIQGGGSDLGTLGRAAGFTLAMALVGKLALSVLSKATQPVSEPLLAARVGTFGSLGDLLDSPNVNELEDTANAVEPSEER